MSTLGCGKRGSEDRRGSAGGKTGLETLVKIFFLSWAVPLWSVFCQCLCRESSRGRKKLWNATFHVKMTAKNFEGRAGEKLHRK